jgi:hypothetical protein
MEKSGEHAMPVQLFTPALVQADQLAPPLIEKYIVLPYTVAASLAKSGVEVMPHQLLLPAPVMAVHVTPLSLDMYILPPFTIAAMYRKSGDTVTPYQLPETGVDMAAVLDG